MDITLIVDVRGEFGHWKVACKVDELYRREFEPLKTTDEPLLAFVTGERLTDSSAVRTVLKARKDAADIIAKELAEMIVNYMGKDDTNNGYLTNPKPGG